MDHLIYRLDTQVWLHAGLSICKILLLVGNTVFELCYYKGFELGTVLGSIAENGESESQTQSHREKPLLNEANGFTGQEYHSQSSEHLSQ